MQMKNEDGKSEHELLSWHELYVLFGAFYNVIWIEFQR